MKKRFIIFTCMMSIIAFLSSAHAINRSSKTSDPDKKKETTELKEVQEKRSWEVVRKTNLPSDKTTDKGEIKRKSEAKAGEKKEEYDYFIDRNNNGIDDRMEGNVGTKEIRKPEISEKKSSRSPERTSPRVSPVTKSREKTKDQVKDEPKKEPKPEKIEKKREAERK